MTSYEEWRVTGADEHGGPVDVIFRHDEHEPEDGARTFVAWAELQDWPDGPHLHRRTVTVTEWEPVEEGQVSASLATLAAEQPSAEGRDGNGPETGSAGVTDERAREDA